MWQPEVATGRRERRAGDLFRGQWHTALVAVATLGLVGLVVADLMFQTEWPVAGDLGLHLVAIEWLREQGLHSWTFGWFGGMPLFHFYFPLPAAVGAAVAELAGLGVAMRVLVVVGPLALPLAVLFLARAGGASRLEAAAAGIGGAGFLHLRSPSELGGTLESAIIGEYSYSIALALAVVYLGVVWPGRARPGRVLAASLLLAAVALSHVIVTMVVVLASGAILLRRDLDAAVIVLGSWGLGLLLSAFWTIPFLVRMPEMAEIRFGDAGAGVVMHVVVEMVPLVVMVLAGLTARPPGRPIRLSPFTALAAAGLVPLVAPVPFFPLRGLPFVLLALCAFGGIALVRTAATARAARAPAAVAATALATVAFFTVLAAWPLTRSHSYLLLRDGSSAPDRGEWNEMRRVLARLPPGAFLWARSPAPDGPAADAFSMFRYTTDQIPLLDGRRTAGGLLQQSAPSSQYAREALRNLSGFRQTTIQPFSDALADFSLGLEQARALGVRYLVLSGEEALSAARSHPGLDIRADSGSWAIAELPGAAVALAFSAQPQDPCRAEHRCRDWFATAPDLPATVIGRWTETDIRLENERIRFSTPHPGRPHLIRLSYFPEWRLETPGEGPRRFGPNQMLVTPRSTEVVLRFSPGWPVALGRGATLLGLLAAMGLWLLILREARLRGR